MNKLIILCALLVVLLFGCQENVHVIVIPRHYSNFVSVKIVSPQNGEVLNSSSVRIAFEAKNFDLSEDKEFHFILDNGPVMVHKSNVPFFLSSLSEGRHIVRVFPTKSWGESVKDPDALAMVQFYVKKNNSGLLNTNLPMLTYNEPVGFFRGDSSKRILLDFIVTNALLSETGYKVVYKIDGVSHNLTFVTPIYLTNLKFGSHSVELDLVDKAGNYVEGNFVRNQMNITIV